VSKIEMEISAPFGTIFDSKAFSSQIGRMVPIQKDGITYNEATLISAKVLDCGTKVILTLLTSEEDATLGVYSLREEE
jgi:hypothetical protein